MWSGFLIALTLAPPPAAQLWTMEGWALVAERDDYSFRVLMNPDSVGLRQSFVSAWVMYDFTAPQRNDSVSGELYLSEKSLWIFDCPAGRTTMVSFIRFSKNHGEGEAVDSASAPAQASRMENFPKDSVANDQIGAVCGVWKKRQGAARPPLQGNAGDAPRARETASGREFVDHSSHGGEDRPTHSQVAVLDLLAVE